MKVLIVRNYPSYMEIKNNTYNIQEVGLAKALVKKKYECDILFWTEGEEEEIKLHVEQKSITVYYRRAFSILKNTIYTQVKDLFEKYDVIQSSEYNQLESVWLAAKYPKKTIVYHGPYFSDFNKRYNLYCKIFDKLFLWIYIRKNTKFITKSELASEYLISKGLNENNVTTIGVGIDAEMLTCEKIDLNSRVYSNIHREGGLKILYVGKVEPRRNVVMIVEIVRRIKEKVPNVQLYIIGSGNEEYIQKVKTNIFKFDLVDNVTWEYSMEQKHLGEIYKMADIFLLPTEYEIFGMVLLEAMYYGMLVLTTNNGGAKTLIRNGKNGFVLAKNDIDAWVEIIENYYYKKNEFKNIKEEAQRTVKNKFTWDALVNNFIEEYRRLEEYE